MSSGMAELAGLEAWYPRMVEWRRHLHRHPELSYQESATAAFVAARLREFGLEPRTNVGGHGVTADLTGGRPGPVVALRADMDALPIQDEKTCDYRSTVPGVMHACGHDAHTAALLGLAGWLAGRRDRLAGTVRFVFQPAEEISPGGALPMIRDGVLDGVERIYGVHLWTPLPAGTVATRGGALMALADEFRAVIRGRGGHGGLPHETVDSVVIAAQLIMSWQTVVSRSVDPLAPCVVSVGSVRAGRAFNVIAKSAELNGTVRAFDEAVRDEVAVRLERMLHDTCRMYGGSAEWEYRRGYPPVVNDPAEAGRALAVARRLFGDAAVKEMPPVMAAEDFAYYMRERPGCFLFVGAGNREAAAHPHHHPLFDVEETAMLQAARLLGALALGAD